MSNITATTTTEGVGKLVFSTMSACKGYGAEVRRHKVADTVWGGANGPHRQMRYRVVLCDYSEATPRRVVLMEFQYHKTPAVQACKRIMGASN